MGLREKERASIRAFLLENADVFRDARVLDYGAGREPYRALIEDAGGEYVPYDSPTFPASLAAIDTTALCRGRWDVIVCTQVVQYVPDVPKLLATFHAHLTCPGVLLMTGPTNWPIVEREDLWRLTVAGVRTLAERAGFRVEHAGYRHATRVGVEEYPHGWALRAVAC